MLHFTQITSACDPLQNDGPNNQIQRVTNCQKKKYFWNDKTMNELEI